MKKWQYAVIAAVVIVCVLTAAFLFGDTSQPETGEKTLSTPDSTIQSAPLQEQPAVSTAPAAAKPSTAATTETEAPATEAPTTQSAATEASTAATTVTEPPATEAATTPSTATEPSATQPPATESPTTEPATTEPATTAATEPQTEPQTEPPTEAPVPQCTIYISCATVLSHMDNLKAGKEAIVPENGWILGTVSVELLEGDTVFDVLQRVTKQYGIALEFSVSPVYNTAYIEGIGNLYERDCGTGSGWLYAVNGSFPSVGCSDYTLSDGDSIAWLYTCEMGADLS